MVRLKNGDLITEEIKKAFKEKTTYSYLDVYNGETLEYTFSYDDYLTKVEYYDDKCDPEDGKFIGKATTRQIDVEIKNIDNQFNIDGKEVEYVIGVFLDNGETAEISYGRFIPSEIENKEIEETTTFTAYDYMSKTDIPYTCTIKAFPVTLVDFAKDVCSQCGVNLGNTNFRNANKRVINANPFQGGENCREVVKSIAKLSFSVAYIDIDNRLYFGFEQKDTTDEEITTDDYFELYPNTQPEPLNKVTLRSSEVKASGQSIGYKGNYSNDSYYLVGDIVNYNNTKYYCIQEGKGNLPTNETYWEVYTAFEINDVKELIIEEDYFAYTDTLRNEFLKEAVDLYGLVYYPVEIDLLGSIYLQFNDTLKITNSKNKELKTYCFNNDHTYNGVLYNTITSPSLTDEEEKHNYQTEQDTFSQRTYIEIDKANKSIVAAIKKLGEATSQYVQLKAQLDEIEAEIGSITDITITGEGYGKLTFTDINQSEPIYMRVHAQGEDITPLYPSDNLYPRNDLYPHNREIIFKNTTDGTEIEYNLPSNLYYLDEDTYDEFVLDYENTQCYVIHRVEIIEGQKVKRTNEIIENIDDYPSIPLTEGDYTITIPYCLSAYLYIRLMAKNIYTSQFATKVELRSSLKLTEESIISEVNKEITPVKGDVIKLSSQIEQTVKSISLKVNNGETTAGIVITLEREDGTSQELEGTIDMKGIVNFNDLKGTGTTTINGANIMTGTITANKIDTSKLTLGTSNTGSEISASGIDWLTGQVNSPSGQSSNPIAYFGAFNKNNMHLPRHSVGAEIWDNGDIYLRRLYTESGADSSSYMGFIKTVLASNRVASINYILGHTSAGSRGINVNTYAESYDIYASTSDEQLKENIVDAEIDGLSTINKIRLISFNWKDTGKYQALGFSAQQLQTICEDFVNAVKQPENSKYDEILQVRDFNILPYVVKGLQEASAELKEVKEENENLKLLIKNLSERIDKLEGNKNG